MVAQYYRAHIAVLHTAVDQLRRKFFAGQAVTSNSSGTDLQRRSVNNCRLATLLSPVMLPTSHSVSSGTEARNQNWK